jgi:hypothetical protein
MDGIELESGKHRSTISKITRWSGIFNLEPKKEAAAEGLDLIDPEDSHIYINEKLSI